MGCWNVFGIDLCRAQKIMMMKFYFGNYPQCLKTHEQKGYDGGIHNSLSVGTASILLKGQLYRNPIQNQGGFK